jgi:hypothetical protein
VELNSATLEAAQAIALNAALAEVASAMHERGVRPLLIKGPVVASWLYDDPGQRPYSDVDLLVDPERFDAAEVILAGLGFRDVDAGLRPGEGKESEHTWLRAGERAVFVDLHRAIPLVGAPPARAWALLSDDAREHTVAGIRIDTPAPAAHLVILALHAAQHGPRVRHPLADLSRAIARVELATWLETGALAAGLHSAGAMREGLRLVPGGIELADRLALADDAPRSVRLRVRAAPIASVAIEQLIATRGARARLTLLARKLMPSPAFMRLSRPVARRGRSGLALAYLWRALRLMANLPRGSVTWLGVALPAPRRARIPALLRGACWALRAWLCCRVQLRRGGLRAVRLPSSPSDRPGAQSGVHRALAHLPASCLERSLIRQRWHAARGRPLDVVIGVRGPAAKFGAHAWLDGDRPDPEAFHELARWPPPAYP